MPTPLPKIGSPATHALASVGISTLEGVARLEESALLDLHGVGPKAIRLLVAALDEAGLSFKSARKPARKATAKKPAPAPEVDAFLEKLPPDQRGSLEKLRKVIRAAAPGATEGISYGVPMFKLDGRPLVSLGAGKGHCAFYVMSLKVMDAHAPALSAYEVGKGSIRFAPGTQLPASLVKNLVKARIAENRALEAKRAEKKRR